MLLHVKIVGVASSFRVWGWPSLQMMIKLAQAKILFPELFGNLPYRYQGLLITCQHMKTFRFGSFSLVSGADGLLRAEATFVTVGGYFLCGHSACFRDEFVSLTVVIRAFFPRLQWLGHIFLWTKGEKIMTGLGSWNLWGHSYPER